MNAAARDDARLDDLPRGDFVLFVGDATRDKGVDALLHAYSRLSTPTPLVLIGRNSFDASASAPWLRALGPWPHELVMEAWRRSTVAVVPSILPEAFGLAALEASAVGTPVVASDTGGLPDIIVSGENGLLVPPGDAGALLEALERLLEDASLRERMGQAGQRRARMFAADSVVPRFEDAYKTLLAQT
jgi:glycosyltransferase involved in cell wall biosynthesis